ncbi:MAG: anthranilate phosphoribosyltransferase [Verrucomicrobia bacterium TMED56]|nr:MAG: anthranilate phosphoribosyltransferase [Verrucomicrobia bacterium TMED56]OUU44134.1 MAG: anthranilate phosphoribosyltransferase [Verrucomicrobia bacterium TMED56]
MGSTRKYVAQAYNYPQTSKSSMNDTSQLSASSKKLKSNQNLSQGELTDCIQEITKESVSLIDKKDFLKSLAKKGETEEEFEVFVREFRKLSIDPELGDITNRAIDLCGTGGDRAHSFNISTFVSFLVASAGVPVIKHGNRSVSSKCGSADLIEAIGIPINPTKEKIREGLKELGYCFLFAPHFHPSFKHIGPVRKELAKESIITIFNLLGPTINPAKPAYQLLGVFDEFHMQKIGNSLSANGVRSGLVVHGLVSNEEVRGVDELTNCGDNRIFGIGEKSTSMKETWTPSKWSQNYGSFSDLTGGSLNENLEIMKKLLSGNAPDALLATVLINASTAFWIYGRCQSLEEGIELSQSLLTNGTLQRWINKVSDFYK